MQRNVSCRYAFSQSALQKKMRLIPRSMVALIGDPYYRLKELGLKRATCSFAYAEKIENLFASSSTRILRHYGRHADCDLISFATSNVTVVNRHGGFANIIKKLVSGTTQLVVI